MVLAVAIASALLTPGCRRTQPAKDASSAQGQVSRAGAASSAAQSSAAGSQANPAPPVAAITPPPVQAAGAQAVGLPGMDAGRVEQSGPVSCVDYEKYAVISRELQDQVGSDTLVKFKAAKDEHIACEYSAGASDFEIKNEFAESFIGLHGDLLFLDSSTMPGEAGLTIYNVSSRKKVFQTAYLGPTEVTGDNMSLWQVAQNATRAECPDAEKIAQQGLTPTLERRMILNLRTFALAETKETRCGVEQ
jgi:hypothetical protein